MLWECYNQQLFLPIVFLPMGRRKFRLGRLPKNYDRPSGDKRVVGRPRKSSASGHSSRPTSDISAVSDSNDMPMSSTPNCSSSAGSPSGRPSSSDFSTDISCPSMFSDVSSYVTGETGHESELCEQQDSFDLTSTSVSNDDWMKLLNLPNEKWVIQVLNLDLCLCKLSCNLSQTLIIPYSVVVMPDHHWTLKVHGHQVDLSQCSVLSDYPMQLCKETLQSLLSLLDTCNICAGHPEPDFVRMAEARKGKLFSRNRDKIVAWVDTSSEKTIRSSMCEMIVKGKKCSACMSYRNTLRKSYHRWNAQKSQSPRRHQCTSSKTNFRFLSTPEKTKRYSSLRARYDAKSKRVERMKSKISALVGKNGVSIGEMSSDFTHILHEMTGKVHEQNHEGSFRHLFWDEQIKALSKSDSRQI